MRKIEEAKSFADLGIPENDLEHIVIQGHFSPTGLVHVIRGRPLNAAYFIEDRIPGLSFSGASRVVAATKRTGFVMRAGPADLLMEIFLHWSKYDSEHYDQLTPFPKNHYFELVEHLGAYVKPREGNAILALNGFPVRYSLPARWPTVGDFARSDARLAVEEIRRLEMDGCFLNGLHRLEKKYMLS